MGLFRRGYAFIYQMPLNKLVSLTWLLWALRGFPRFTLNYITNDLFTVKNLNCRKIRQKSMQNPSKSNPTNFYGYTPAHGQPSSYAEAKKISLYPWLPDSAD